VPDLYLEIARFKRYQEPCTIAILDHDEFKQVNDTHGHIAGDKVLATTSEIIKGNLRANDKLFRYGGDEWLIIMPATTLDMAEASLSRIQSLLGQHIFKSDRHEAFYANISYGLASCTLEIDPESWIANADGQLYAKRLKQAQ
jgi:diguanylate cyclase (GGDEF)-like protein